MVASHLLLGHAETLDLTSQVLVGQHCWLSSVMSLRTLREHGRVRGAAPH